MVKEDSRLVIVSKLFIIVKKIPIMILSFMMSSSRWSNI